MANTPQRDKPQGPPPKPPRNLRFGLPTLGLLPVTIFVAVLMLSVRVTDVWRGLAGLHSAGISVNESEAQQPPPPGGRKPGQKTPAQPDAAPAGQSGGSGNAANGANSPAPPEEPGSSDGEPPTFTQNEIDVLQKLSVRREALDSRQKDLDLRENLVKAAEARIDKKIAEMKSLQTNIEGMLKQVDRQDEEKLKSLVKIYESMKPKDAARILNTLDLPIQLDVLGRMKEAKAATILGMMTDDQAKAVTDAIAARRAAKAEGQLN
jgi:flagellar motility protein MotE (MotC chaperone)